MTEPNRKQHASPSMPGLRRSVGGDHDPRGRSKPFLGNFSTSGTIGTIVFALLLALQTVSCALIPIGGTEAQTIHEQMSICGDVESAALLLSDALPVDTEVIVFGEMHYMQEHAELQAAFLPLATDKGFTMYAAEQMHAYSWIAEDYGLGLIDQLKYPVDFAGKLLLEEIRSANADPASTPFRYVHIDMNHWRGVLQDSLMFAEQLGQVDFGAFFTSLYAESIDSGEYQAELQRLIDLLKREPAQYRLAWGVRWYDRVLEMLEIESRSSELRNSWDDARREAIMVDLVEKRLEEVSGGLIVNCGANHAQKEYFRGDGPGGSFDVLGEVVSASHRTYSVSCYGLSGTKRAGYDSPDFDFDVLNGLLPGDLFRYIRTTNEGGIVFLPLTHDFFLNSMLVNRSQVIPARQYDAYLLYPAVTIKQSMYDFAR